MNGIVAITKVTNSLSVGNNNEYNQVLRLTFITRAIIHKTYLLILRLQNGDLQYNNGFHNGDRSALYNRGRKNKMSSDLTSCSVASNLQCPFIDSSSEQEDLSEHQYYHPEETKVDMGCLVITDHHNEMSDYRTGTLLVHIPPNNQISHVPPRAQELPGNSFADNEALERSRGSSESHQEGAGAEKLPRLTLQLISQI